MDDERRDLVGAYWRFCELSSEDRTQCMAADELWWAREAVRHFLVQAPFAEVIGLFDDLLAAQGAGLSPLGAGPLEDFLKERPIEERSDVAAAVAEQCRRSEIVDWWRAALASVWIVQADRDLLPALDVYLPVPIDRR